MKLKRRRLPQAIRLCLLVKVFTAKAEHTFRFLILKTRRGKRVLTCFKKSKFESALCPAKKLARRELREDFVRGGIVLEHRPPEQNLHKPRDASVAF